ncbi:ABC transporter [Haematobacter missouriensis]|uniref:Glutathione import ATP-binding protein GsiA n=1 Tax=Haematobacter missouriensis TaxID=366616 RepID=A0A212AKU1_9RHOB|nr:ABC transporter ATP-binding protein [Haematobacter missouriensis]KFI29505.1 ABC transporter [Haematobacter missouriensis]OWJ80096.1 ABC transporter ATP-binding protein [Haematobacter missouriensis]OWJ82134.1 ABC transporter ATP-binding protein [Haematobacter missouriensis]
MTSILEVNALEVTYRSGMDEVRAVKGVSFNVAEGESYGLVGESGSGKSTVLRALCGLAPVSGGALLMERREIASPRTAEFYRRVQMVFQDPYASLHPRHTVDRVLAEPLAIHGFDKREHRIEAALTDVGLGPSFRFRYPHQLSGGQRQRVAIARALILEPRILLLDEPTSALDASIQAEVLNLLERLRTERGLTYVLVSHDLAVVAHMCERLMVMQHGRTVEELTRDALRRHEAREPYTRTLLAASEGYTPLAAPAP